MIQGWLGFPYILSYDNKVIAINSREIYNESAKIDGLMQSNASKKFTLADDLYGCSPNFYQHNSTGNFNNFSMILSVYDNGGPGSVRPVLAGAHIFNLLDYKPNDKDLTQYSMGSCDYVDYSKHLLSQFL